MITKLKNNIKAGAFTIALLTTLTGFTLAAKKGGVADGQKQTDHTFEQIKLLAEFFCQGWAGFSCAYPARLLAGFALTSGFAVPDRGFSQAVCAHILQYSTGRSLKPPKSPLLVIPHCGGRLVTSSLPP